jgi:hypothetical protein
MGRETKEIYRQLHEEIRRIKIEREEVVPIDGNRVPRKIVSLN